MNELNGEMSYLYGIDVSCVVIVHCMNDYDFFKVRVLIVAAASHDETTKKMD